MIVEFKNIGCGYKKKKVVSDLNLTFQSGEALCILGPNGIGKTTVFKSIIGDIPLLSGEIWVDNLNLFELSLSERAKIFAYVPQARNYAYHFMVKDIVMMGRASLIPRFSLPRKEDIDFVDKTLFKLGIVEYAERYYCELSGGEQQIVLLARAIVQDSKFILLDEPASNLDFLNQKKLLRIIEQLKTEGKGIVMVSHSPGHALNTCEKSLLLDRNGVFKFGDTQLVVTGENLTHIYGTNIVVANAAGNTDKKICYLD